MNQIPFRTIAILSLLADVKSPDGIHLQRLKEQLIKQDRSCEKSISPTLTALKKKGCANNPLVSMWAITEKGIEYLIELQAQEKERQEKAAAEAAAKAAAEEAAKASTAAAPVAQAIAIDVAALTLSIESLGSRLTQQIDRGIGGISHEIGRQLEDRRKAMLGDYLQSIGALSQRIDALTEAVSRICLVVERLDASDRQEPQKTGPIAAPVPTTSQPKPKETERPIELRPEPAAKKPAHHKPSILVIGLLNGQMQRISKRYSKFADLAFIDSQRANVHEIKAACNGRDHVLQMTSFTSHSVDEAVRCATGKAPTRVNGALSTLNREIESILLQNIAKP
jgi:DNA-binding PadR family transcriptional regulator